MQWLGPSLIYLTSPLAIGATIWQYRRHRVPVLSLSLLGLSAAQVLFIGGVTLIGVASGGLQFFANVFGLR